ncbi:SDR family NAD(P)-dependent oxidoreductase [Massilia sp. IC2-476]|uniref:SDR family NAD(P)-dependent oxidoreductase n=1 Tax=Massilia sp. IC2-476 TaxID=2887199 RepID=UPI001D1123E1|nr:SDR family oxidoreductase [Massilia sp. IC2-476]MCC2973912.1 SDR family oxidoreductase [Massilia sp. IC2-476]
MLDNEKQEFAYATYPDLRGKRVVVTGGGSGIGAELTAAFAGQGAQVVFLDIAEEASRELEASLAGSEHAPRFVRCDLTDLDQLKAVFAGIEESLGGVDILLNNAANDDRHEIEDVTPAYWDSRMNVNLRHKFFCTQAVLPGMKQRGAGVILNFGSISWHLPHTQLHLYMTAKAGIEGMTRALAREVGKYGIRANTVVPGAVRTPRQQALWHNPEEEARILAGQCIPERVEMQDVAALALFLASSNARRCSGREYFVDAGWYGA